MSAEEAHLVAVVAKIAATGANAYGIGELAALAVRPEHYTEVMVMERNAEQFRLGGVASMRFYRVLTRAVADEYANAQWERDRATEGLSGAYVTVDGVVSTVISKPISDDPIALDEGKYSGLQEWSYGI